MASNVSRTEKQATFMRPRHLTQSEIDSLRQDLVSAADEMKKIIRDMERGSEPPVIPLTQAVSA